MINTIVQLGLVYSLLAVGIYITYSLLNFPDLGVDGTITLGGCVTVIAILGGVPPYLATALAIVAGSLAGTLTGLLHVKGKINGLISGIITTTALYSINLSLAGGKPNLSLATSKTIFTPLMDVLSRNIAFIVVLVAIVVVVKIILNIVFDSKFGIFLRCVGSNPALVSTMGANVGGLKIVGLAISNALVAFCGSVVVQHQGYYDIGMSIGSLILGLTMVIMGLTLAKLVKGLQPSLGVMLGALCYQAIIGAALMWGLPTIYLRLSTAVLLVLFLVVRRRDKANDSA